MRVGHLALVVPVSQLFHAGPDHAADPVVFFLCTFVRWRSMRQLPLRQLTLCLGNAFLDIRFATIP
jgi:hypothetical protein